MSEAGATRVHPAMCGRAARIDSEETSSTGPWLDSSALAGLRGTAPRGAFGPDLSRRAVRGMDAEPRAPGEGFTASRRLRCGPDAHSRGADENCVRADEAHQTC